MINIAIFRPEEKNVVSRIKGVNIINVPVTKTMDLSINVAEVLEQARNIDFIVFTSSLAVWKLNELLNNQLDSLLKECGEVIAIGNETARALNMSSVTIPVKKSTEGIAEYLSDKSGRVLLVRSKQGSPKLVSELSKHMRVSVLDVYDAQPVAPDNRHVEFSRELAAKRIDALIFTSPMIVASFFNIFSNIDPELLKHISKILKVAIGMETEKKMRDLNIGADYVLSEPDIKVAINMIKKKIEKS